MKQPLFVLSSIAFLACNSVQAAGFDCQKATTKLEKTICADNKLSAADTELTQLYVAARTSLAQKAARQSLKEEQKAWLAKRTKDCKENDAFCLLKLYEERIASLKAMTGVSSESWDFSSSIQANLPEAQFKLFGHKADDRYFIQRVEISLDGKTQTIDSYGTEKLEAEVMDLKDSGFVIEDVNFDGYKDIRLMEGLMAGPDVPYIYWLFEPQQKSFVYSEAFSELTSPVIDAQKKQITVPWRDGAMGTGESIYTVEKDKPVLIREETRYYQDNGSYKLTVKELKNGEMQVVDEQTVKE